MKGSHATPAQIAQVDQMRAACDKVLDWMITEFHSHAALHQGETTCSFAHAYAIGQFGYSQTETASLLAAAVARLAALR